MLNPFPDLLAFGLLAPLLLRVALGVVFIHFGWSKLKTDREQKTAFFETLGLKPGAYYSIGIGVIEIVSGLLLVVGLYTQIAALVALVISAKAYYLKGKHPQGIDSSRGFLALLAVISLSLLFSGAGFLAFDLPL